MSSSLSHIEQERALVESLPGVHVVEAAGRGYPRDGIEKGDRYYHWSTPHGGLVRSKNCPRPSTLDPGPSGIPLRAREGIVDAVGDVQKLREAVVAARDDISAAIGWHDEVALVQTGLVSELEDIYEALVKGPNTSELLEIQDGLLEHPWEFDV